MALAADGPGFLPAHLLGYVLEGRGWRPVHLAAVQPADVDELAAEQDRPAVVVVSVEGTTLTDLREYARRVRTGLPDTVVVAFGPADRRAALQAVPGVDGAASTVQAAAALVARLAAPLSDRELEVLALVAEGRSNREVAEALDLAASTVKSHLDRVFDKLGAPDRAAAVALAVRSGWIS